MSTLIIGLTGQTGAGKSTVSQIFIKQNFAVIDCDQIAREVTAPGTKGLSVIVSEFSNAILNPDKSLDRRALGKIVFSNKQKLDRLNKIIFPIIMDKIHEKINLLKTSGKRIIILDAPTLFESGADKLCHLIISVTASNKIRIHRIMQRDGITEGIAKARIYSQKSEMFFRNHSDFIIENNDGLDCLIKQINEASRQIRMKSNDH